MVVYSHALSCQSLCTFKFYLSTLLLLASVAGPGFPRGGGAPTPKGVHQPIIWQYFYQKLHENERERESERERVRERESVRERER